MDKENTDKENTNEEKELEPTKQDLDLLQLLVDLLVLLMPFVPELSLQTKGPIFARGRSWMQIFEDFFDYVRSFLTKGLPEAIAVEVKEGIEKLRPMDDLLFRHIMAGAVELLRKFLRDITGIVDLVLGKLETQCDFPSIGGYRGIITDAFAKSVNEAMLFVVEAQNNAKQSDIKRGLEELYVVGSRALETGDEFKDLPDEYIIFVVDKDIFGDGKILHRQEIVTKDGKGAHVLFLWCREMDFDALPDPEDDIDKDRWVEICTWSNDFVQKDYQNIRNAEFSELVRVAKTVEKGKKVNAMSEELYLQWEMKYRGSLNRKVDEKVRDHDYELARGLLSDGMSVDALAKRMKIPREDLLRMQAELNGAPV